MNRKMLLVLAGAIAAVLIITMLGFNIKAKQEVPSWHDELASQINLYVTNPTDSNEKWVATSRMIESKNARVSTLLNIQEPYVDLMDLMKRMRFFNNTLPTSIWLYEINGTVVAVMRIIGPYQNPEATVSRYFIEVARLSLMEMTVTFPDGYIVTFDMPYGEEQPTRGYAFEFLDNWSG